MLTSVAAFLDATRAPYSELVCKIVISFIFLVLFTRYSPKNDNLLDIVMFTAQLCTFSTLFYVRATPHARPRVTATRAYSR